jgi:hypothetical protein
VTDKLTRPDALESIRLRLIRDAARPPSFWHEIMSETEWAEYKDSVAASFILSRDDLRGFLGYLDEMRRPVSKRDAFVTKLPSALEVQ